MRSCPLSSAKKKSTGSLPKKVKLETESGGRVAKKRKVTDGEDGDFLTNFKQEAFDSSE